MILEIDAGNSNIKWRTVNKGSIETLATGKLMNAADDSDLGRELEQMLTGLSHLKGSIDRVKVSSVRGEEFEASFSTILAAKWSIEAEFARVEGECGGVINSYTNTNLMGVDRWMAMLAAYDKVATSCCILDCGSAITFDWINAEGSHQGGYIVPGLHLMKESLSRKTSALDVSIKGWSSPLPASNTEEAISGGIIAMITGFVEHCNHQVQDQGAQVCWFLTGGDAELVGKYLPWEYRLEKDLVLDGLAIALP